MFTLCTLLIVCNQWIGEKVSAACMQRMCFGSADGAVCLCVCARARVRVVQLALDWRKNLVRALHQRYLDKDCLFYALNNVDGRVRNMS